MIPVRIYLRMKGICINLMPSGSFYLAYIVLQHEQDLTILPASTSYYRVLAGSRNSLLLKLRKRSKRHGETKGHLKRRILRQRPLQVGVLDISLQPVHRHNVIPFRRSPLQSVSIYPSSPIHTTESNDNNIPQQKQPPSQSTQQAPSKKPSTQPPQPTPTHSRN